jgi:hypothetical protein
MTGTGAPPEELATLRWSELPSSMKILRITVGLVGLVGCLSTPGVHPTLHPAAPGTGENAGIALGALVQHADDDTSAQFGYGEGWVRLGEKGEFELRTTPQAAFAAIDIPVAPNISLRPSVGLSVLRFDQSISGMSDTTTVGVIHPGLSLVIQSGSLYVAPRAGFSRSAVIEGDGDGESAFSVAGTVGFRLDHRMTLELTAAYSRNFDDEVDTAWTVVPSLGISIGGAAKPKR